MSLVVVSTWSRRISRIVLFFVNTCFEQKSFVLCENGCDKKQEMRRGHLRYSFESILIWQTKCENLAKKRTYQTAILGDFFVKVPRCARNLKNSGRPQIVVYRHAPSTHISLVLRKKFFCQKVSSLSSLIIALSISRRHLSSHLQQ